MIYYISVKVSLKVCVSIYNSAVIGHKCIDASVVLRSLSESLGVGEGDI